MIEEHYATFETFLDEYVSSGKSDADFEEICTICGVPAEEIRNYVMETFGVPVEKVIESYRTHSPVYLL